MMKLEEILARGEDSQHQFKQNINNSDSLSAEMVAMADEQPILNTSQDDLDQQSFLAYYKKKRYGEELAKTSSKLLQNLGLLKFNQLTLTGLLFGKNPQRFKPICVIKAIMFPSQVGWAASFCCPPKKPLHEKYRATAYNYVSIYKKGVKNVTSL